MIENSKCDFDMIQALLWGTTCVLVYSVTSCGADEMSMEGRSGIEVFPGEMRDIDVKSFVAEMRVGWSLGNSLDTRNKDKTRWGNPWPNQEIIDTVYEAGYRTLRLKLQFLLI